MCVCHVIIILSLLCKDTTCKEPPGYSVQLNGDVTVQEGLCVTIPCTFTADNTRTFTHSTGYWKTSDKEIVASNNKSAKVVKPNFHLTGNPDTGDCSLTITAARRKDAGTYYFRFEESIESPIKCNYVTNKTVLTVTGLTWKPQISNPGKLFSGREVTLTCSPTDNCSGVSLVFQWTKSDQDGIWKTSANVTFTPSPSDHQQSITCKMILPPANTSTQETIRLDVYYPPRQPDVIISSSLDRTVEASLSVTINEGETLTLNCTVDSNPAATVRWIKGDVTVDLNNSIGQEVVKVTSSEADTYRCFAWNRHGVSEKRIQVISEQDGNSTLRDIMIGIMCAMGIVLAVLLITKITKKQMSKKPNNDPTAESPNFGDPTVEDPNQLYMNVRKIKQRSMVKQTSMRVDTRSIVSDQDEELNYSNISFPTEPSRVSIDQPESEYAQIKPKRVI